MITDQDILEVKISKKMLEKATTRAEAFKGNSYTFSKHIDSRIAGFVAEEIFANNFPGVKVSESNYKDDVVVENLGSIDIKTKRCKSKPKIDYSCSVSKYQAEKESSNYYLFCRCSYDFKTLWILGMISKKEFMENAIFVKAGERDGGFVCRTDMYNVPISSLYNFAEVIYQ